MKATYFAPGHGCVTINCHVDGAPAGQLEIDSDDLMTLMVVGLRAMSSEDDQSKMIAVAHAAIHHLGKEKFR